MCSLSGNQNCIKQTGIITPIGVMIPEAVHTTAPQLDTVLANRSNL